jgi:hypothetical protein
MACPLRLMPDRWFEADRRRVHPAFETHGSANWRASALAPTARIRRAPSAWPRKPTKDEPQVVPLSAYSFLSREAGPRRPELLRRLAVVVDRDNPIISPPTGLSLSILSLVDRCACRPAIPSYLVNAYLIGVSAMTRSSQSPRKGSSVSDLGRQQAGETPVPSRWTPQAVRALGVSTDLRTAGQIFGLSLSTAYKLVKQGEFPVPVLRAGTMYVVPVAPILTILRIDLDPAVPDTANSTASAVDVDEP